VYGVRTPPEGFLEWALQNGAIQMKADIDWAAARPKR